ncbi:hypothetical protein [Novosphingobium resinovorum]|uniref:hypothetical protein n=1 Tax=Novosphingobium resinovorum TaxID=158500 RepID=UPI002ED4A34F|nr:hypothetical protein [Novosphingobium resinovorum]
MNETIGVEQDIERIAIDLHGKFWAFLIRFLADKGCIAMDDFLSEMSIFSATSPDISLLERSILKVWHERIERTGSHDCSEIQRAIR